MNILYFTDAVEKIFAAKVQKKNKKKTNLCEKTLCDHCRPPSFHLVSDYLLT